MRTSLAIIALAALAPLPVAAQPIVGELKVTASDAGAGDVFGWSVAISGTTAIVGAFRDDDAGVSSGSAYIFDTTTGEQLFKLTATDTAAGDEFGISVAISGTTAIVGAYEDDDAGSDSGSAYIFDATTGEQLFKLTASDAAAGDRFGTSVAISGTTAIIGASYSDAWSGSAYIFDTTTGEQLFKLTASDAAESDRFGESVAISGTTAIIGAHLDDDAGSGSGSAYLFNTTTGEQLFKLTASDAAEGDTFGGSVAISGITAIIGAYRDGDAGPFSGSAYIFDATTGEQLFKLTASDASSTDNFGESVAISGTTAIVGASRDDDRGSNTGSAYIFDTTTGEQLLKLTASDAAFGDNFGESVAISGINAFIGAPGDDDAGASSGSAYICNICPTDLDGSGTTDLTDLNLVLSNFGMTTTTGDTNNDGVVDLADLNAVLAAFGTPCP